MIFLDVEATGTDPLRDRILDLRLIVLQLATQLNSTPSRRPPPPAHDSRGRVPHVLLPAVP